jgi:hypothetical protein
MNRDNSNASLRGLGFEAKLEAKAYYKDLNQDNEILSQRDAVFEGLFKYFTVLMVLGVILGSLRIRETGWLLSYPIQWASALGLILMVLMRRKISFQYQIISLWLLGLIYAGVGIFTYGILGQGLLILLFLSVFATLGGRALHGYIVACLATILTIVAGIAFHKEWFAVSVNPVSYVVSIEPWVTASDCFYSIHFLSGVPW